MEATNAVVGNHIESGYICLDPECRKLYPEAKTGRPIFEGDATSDGYFMHCSCCMETLDAVTEVLRELRAPIPASDDLIRRARALGLMPLAFAVSA